MEKNNLVITNVDIKQVEPVDAQTRLNLQKTVSLAIEISTKKQEVFYDNKKLGSRNSHSQPE